MGRRIVIVVFLAFPLGFTQAFAAPAASAPDPEYGKKLATDLLVGTGEQEQANADIPSFHEKARPRVRSWRIS
jgi:hypothetical protein